MNLRQLDLSPDQAMDPALRSLREQAFRDEMEKLTGWFPDRASWAEEFQNVRMPADAKSISPEHGDAGFRQEVVQRLVDTAASIAGNKPDAAGHGRVAAIVDWPLLFGSEICVFFDRGYERAFAPETDQQHGRTYWPGGWVCSAAPERNLFDDLDIAMPAGFAAAGIALTEYSKDTDHTYRYERWVAMETLERIAQ